MILNIIPSLPLEAWGAILVIVGYAWRSLSQRSYQRPGMGMTIVQVEAHSAFADIVIVAGVVTFIYGVVV